MAFEMTLFNNIGKETITREYKAFSLKVDPYMFYDEHEIKKICTVGKIDQRFNQLIMKNVSHFIKYYIPRYISAFSSLEEENGELYFGVDDFGEITGIPFLGNLDKDEILKKIKKSIRESVITTDETKDYLMETIDVKIIKLKIDPYLFYSNLDETIKLIESSHSERKKMVDDYYQEWCKWQEKLHKYTIKLKNVLHNPETFQEFAEYIKERDPTKLHVLSQVDNFDEDLKNVAEFKKDDNNLMYWICNFRDDFIDIVVAERPMKPKIASKKMNYYNEFIKLYELREKLIKNNPNVNYYLLKIKLPTKTKDDVFYVDKCGVIKKRIRGYDTYGAPACL